MNNTTALLYTPGPSRLGAERMVIPVRYVAREQVVHATSVALSADEVQIRSASPPETGSTIGLKLYFPNGGGVVSRGAIVAETLADEFRAEFNDGNEVARHRLAEVLWKREIGLRPYPRFHTHMKATLRQRGGPALEGYVSNISRSGAFVRMEQLPPQGSVSELDVLIPGEDYPHTVHAYVVHLAPRRGIGVQFIGASEEFIIKIDEYLANLARGVSRIET